MYLDYYSLLASNSQKEVRFLELYIVVLSIKSIIHSAIITLKGSEYMELYLLDKKSFSYLEKFYLQNLSPQQLIDITYLPLREIELELFYLLQLNFITNADGLHCDSEGIQPKNIYEITPVGRAYYEAVLEQRKLDKNASWRANIALVISISSILVTMLK